MAHISTSEDGLTGISLENKLELLDLNTSSLKFTYTNTLEKEDTDSNDSNFIRHLHSPNKTHFAAITGNKKLLVWNMESTETEPVSFLLPKRPTCLCFCNQSATVLVGDKTGDVYRCQYGDGENRAPQLLLGHLSMVLDVVMSRDDKLVVTVDRDEKIRVSHYPNAYNIYNYCLGHNQLVSTVAITTGDRLVSGAGDATLKLWDYKDGRELACWETSVVDPALKVISKISYHNGTVAVMGEGSTSIVFLTCHGDALKLEHTQRMDRQPHDICFRSGKLLVLVNDANNPLISLHKVDGAYTQTSVPISSVSSLAELAFPGEVKTYTDLLKVDATKRLSVQITPEATINNVVMVEEKTPNEPSIPEVVSTEA